MKRNYTLEELFRDEPRETPKKRKRLPWEAALEMERPRWPYDPAREHLVVKRDDVCLVFRVDPKHLRVLEDAKLVKTLRYQAPNRLMYRLPSFDSLCKYFDWPPSALLFGLKEAELHPLVAGEKRTEHVPK
jgi:hypothetical protein